jgi:hypothetical protein
MRGGCDGITMRLRPQILQHLHQPRHYRCNLTSPDEADGCPAGGQPIRIICRHRQGHRWLRLETVKHKQHVEREHRVHNVGVRREAGVLPWFSPGRRLRTNFGTTFWSGEGSYRSWRRKDAAYHPLQPGKQADMASLIITHTACINTLKRKNTVANLNVMRHCHG